MDSQNSSPISGANQLAGSRLAQAKAYHERTRNQIEWYDNAATKNQKFARFYSVSAIVLGAVVAVIPAIENLNDYSGLLSIIGALIVILRGLERIWMPEEKWTGYRKAAESLTREQERYVEGIFPYNSYDDEDRVYRLFVERCDRVKAEEQKSFWDTQTQTIDSKKPEEKSDQYD